MNEQLQLALAQLLQSVLQAKDFLVAELPDVIHQLLMWKLVSSVLVFALMLSLLLTSIWITRPYLVKLMEYVEGDSLYRNNNGPEEERGLRMMEESINAVPFAIIGGIVTVSLSVVFLTAGLKNAALALQIWLAPKVYLIEYAASLAK